MLFTSWRSVVLVLGETTLLLLAVAGATYVRTGPYGWEILLTTAGMSKALLIVGICQICLPTPKFDLKYTSQPDNCR